MTIKKLILLSALVLGAAWALGTRAYDCDFTYTRGAELHPGTRLTVNPYAELYGKGSIINPGDGMACGPCVSSPAVTCKGKLPDWPAGTLFNQAIAANTTHVWEIKYEKGINNAGSFMLFDGGLKTISISLAPNDFSLDMPCQLTQTSLQQPVSYAPVDTAAWYQCGLEDGRTYFINIKSTLDIRDPYTMTVL